MFFCFLSKHLLDLAKVGLSLDFHTEKKNRKTEREALERWQSRGAKRDFEKV